MWLDLGLRLYFPQGSFVGIMTRFRVLCCSILVFLGEVSVLFCVLSLAYLLLWVVRWGFSAILVGFKFLAIFSSSLRFYVGFLSQRDAVAVGCSFVVVCFLL